MPPERRLRPWLWIALAVPLAVAIGAYILTRDVVPGTGEMRSELRDRGRVVLLGADDLASLAGGSTELLSLPEVEGAESVLRGSDGREASRLLRQASVSALLVDGRGTGVAGSEGSVAQSLSTYQYVPGFRAVYLSPAAALYVPDEMEALDAPLSRALAHVARRLLAGARAPRIASFPEPLRRIRNVEVMVMLRERGRPRLWRSARGSSIASALITSAQVARQRWTEREQAMRGDLDRLLPHLDIEVVLLREDGILGDRSERFVDRVFTQSHGVAYERRGAWRYQLPATTQQLGKGSAARAYRELFVEYGLDSGSLGRADLRLYRLVAAELGRSPAEGGSPSEDTFPEVFGSTLSEPLAD